MFNREKYIEFKKDLQLKYPFLNIVSNNIGSFIDGDKGIFFIESSKSLSEEEKSSIDTFFSKYDFKCSFQKINIMEFNKESVSLSIHHLVRLRKPFGCMFYEKVVVGAWHGNVEVVVPWNKPLMSYSTKHSAAIKPILNVMFVADACNLLKNAKLLELGASQLFLLEFF